MGCKGNIKKHWLFGHYKGKHQFKMVWLQSYVPAGYIFQLREQCELCGITQETILLKEHDLLKMGLTPEQIKEASINSMGCDLTKPSQIK